MADPVQPGNYNEHEPAQRLAKIKAELSASGIPGLIGRVERGLDPMGMIVVTETKQALQPVLDGAGVDHAALAQFTEELHSGGLWRNADRLTAGQGLEVQAWMLLAKECPRADDRDLSEAEFLGDVDRIKAAFAEAAHNPTEALVNTTVEMQTRAGQAFTIEDGVAISNEDAFMFMAMKGETAGISVADKIMFVGSNALDYEVVAVRYGLRKEVRPDPRRGNVDTTFFVGDGGTEVKVLGKGFCIVFGGDKELAKDLARTGQKRNE